MFASKNKWKREDIFNKLYKEFHLKERNIKIAAISETANKQKGSKETNNYIQFYNGVGRNESSSWHNANDTHISMMNY
jgi:inorganic pyrophosphatase/exopolyphosphatase